jgi:outer membrane lipoprotein-sorting protein
MNILKLRSFEMKTARFTTLILLLLLLVISLSYAISYEEILERMSSFYRNLQSFYCILEVYNKAGNTEENVTYEYYFQKPDKLRLEVLEGKDKGTTIVYQNNRIRYKKGGVLSFIPLSLNIDDPIVLSIRKGRINELTFDYILDILSKYKPKSIKEVSIFGYNCYVIEIGESKDRLYNYSMQRIYVEKNTFVPIQLEQYENINGQNELVHKRIYRNFKINLPIDEKIFNI